MRFFVAIGIAGLVVASCGTSAESAATSTSQSTVAAVTPTTTASGVDGERFCEVVAVFDQSDNPFELPQEQARIAIPNKQALMVEAALVAPDGIRTEVKGLVDSFQPIFDLFEAADFDASRIDEAEFEALADAAFSGEGGENDAAGKIMDDWVNIHCGD